MGPGTDYALAANVIAKFEGFSAKAYYDVNAWRIGYGSDTRHVAGGFVHVKRGDATTKADALLDLQRRIPQFERVVIGQVGGAQWARMPQKARAGLLSVAYNYGHLPQNVAIALGQGAPLAGVAEAVAACRHDNKGVNAKRRIAEAAMIRAA